MPGIWVFGEGRDQTLELLNAGENAAKALVTKLVAFTPERPSAEEYIAHGADEVLVLPQLAEGLGGGRAKPARQEPSASGARVSEGQWTAVANVPTTGHPPTARHSCGMNPVDQR